MTTSEIKWNNLCKIHHSLLGEPEQKVQNVWETIFSEFFGYSKLLNEIDAHRTMRLGSTDRLIPDIIIKNNTKDLFVVELKQPSLTKDVTYELQIISYLKQLHADLGILICDRIVLIDYDYNKPDNEQKDFDISFTPDNEDGIAFIELFSKETFSPEKVKAFIDSKTKAKRNEIAIKSEITTELINNLLQNYFASKYSKDDYEKVRKSFNITICFNEEIKTVVHNNVYRNKNDVYHNYSSGVSNSDGFSKSKGIELCISKGFPVGENCTWASENKRNQKFWANPNVDCLQTDWWLLLNDISKKKIYVFFIPINSLKSEQLVLRSDNNSLFDIQIKYDDNTFTDTRSHVKFCKWFQKELKY